MTRSANAIPDSIGEMKDLFQGKRCFILGNGPSLNETNLALIKDEITIGLNRIYMKFSEIGFSTTFLCCANELVLQQFGPEIVQQPAVKFLNARASEYLPKARDTFFMETLPGPGFATDLSEGAWHSGATVTFCGLQLAFHLGITEVVLLGVDHNFGQSGRSHRQSRSRGADVNHFDPNYFGKNVVWQFPDLLESEVNYAIAKEAFRLDGRSVKDATVNGKLRVFDKITGYAVGSRLGEQPETTAPEPIALAGGGDGASKKVALYEALLNTRHRRTIQIAAILMIFSGLGGVGALALRNPAIFAFLVAFLLVASGAALLFGTIATDWMSAWSRRRRLREGKLLLVALRMMEPPASRESETG